MTTELHLTPVDLQWAEISDQ